MIRRVNIRSIYDDVVGPDVAGELRSIYPEGWNSVGMFTCELPWDDPRVRQIVACLDRHGLSTTEVAIRNGKGIPPKHLRYHMEISSDFDARDFEQADYLMMHAARWIDGPMRSEEGPVQLDPKFIKAGVGIARAQHNQTVVTEEVRLRLEAADLSGIGFRDVRVAKSRRAVPRYFELTSDRILPPMSPRCKFVGMRGEEVPADHPGPFVQREGLDFPEVLMLPAQPRYPAEALVSAGPFDLARTRETFGNEDARQFVASARLYRILEGVEGCDIVWIPVILE